MTEAYFVVLIIANILLAGTCILLAGAAKDWKNRYWELAGRYAKLHKAAARQARAKSTNLWKEQVFTAEEES